MPISVAPQQLTVTPTRSATGEAFPTSRTHCPGICPSYIVRDNGPIPGQGIFLDWDFCFYVACCYACWLDRDIIAGRLSSQGTSDGNIYTYCRILNLIELPRTISRRIRAIRVFHPGIPSKKQVHFDLQ
jgi:hypothetical protein